MKKRSKRKNPYAPIEGLDLEERELFLKAFFYRRITKVKARNKDPRRAQARARA